MICAEECSRLIGTDETIKRHRGNRREGLITVAALPGSPGGDVRPRVHRIHQRMQRDQQLLRFGSLGSVALPPSLIIPP